MMAAAALGIQFLRTQMLQDLDQAKSQLREALLLCCASHPDRSALINYLFAAIVARFNKTAELLKVHDLASSHVDEVTEEACDGGTKDIEEFHSQVRGRAHRE